MLGPPGQHQVSDHHRDTEQAQGQQQRVDREARDAEILEEVALSLCDQDPECLAVCPEMGEAEGHADRGLDHQGQQEQDLLIAGQLHYWKEGDVSCCEIFLGLTIKYEFVVIMSFL